MELPPRGLALRARRGRRADFIRERVRAERAAGKFGGAVVTRFPPEPNGYLHIGHAKSICLNFGLARGVRRRAATCASTTRTRPRRSEEYVDSIQEDVRWLGFDWRTRLYYASDYFEQLYELGRAADRDRATPTCAT